MESVGLQLVFECTVGLLSTKTTLSFYLSFLYILLLKGEQKRSRVYVYLE